MTGRRTWTKREDAICRAHLPRAAQALLRGRSYEAIKNHRSLLLHPEPGTGTPKLRWTAVEIARLRREYPIAYKTKYLLPKFPGRDCPQIRGKARHLGIKMRRHYKYDARLDGHKELIDQIRLRAVEDRIPVSKLAKAVGVGPRYFRMNGRERNFGLNLNVIIKAVDYFGGKLVIDWHDR